MAEHQLEHSSEVLVNVHRPEACEGQPCTIHNMTNHSMRTFPQHWRSDRSIMERMCPHGVGHPDPDNHSTKRWMERVHGCDGCCRG